jgi:hypothetical protein
VTAEKIDLETSIDLQVLSSLDYEKMAFGILSTSTYVYMCVYVCAPH